MQGVDPIFPSNLPAGSVEARYSAGLREVTAPLRRQLVAHPLYMRLGSAAALRTFLEHHCYAVWDFMSLAKALQQALTCVVLPWRPPADPAAARLINEIVTVEEADLRPDGVGYASHFELYVEAMNALGADTAPLMHLVALTSRGVPWPRALEDAAIPAAAAEFVATTLSVCQERTVEEVAAFFVLGREDVIPDMFRQVVARLGSAQGLRVGGLLYYLDRHVQVDAEHHGPAGGRLLLTLCGGDEARWELAIAAGCEALRARIRLWDSIGRAIDSLASRG